MIARLRSRVYGALARLADADVDPVILIAGALALVIALAACGPRGPAAPDIAGPCPGPGEPARRARIGTATLIELDDGRELILVHVGR